MIGNTGFKKRTQQRRRNRMVEEWNKKGGYWENTEDQKNLGDFKPGKKEDKQYNYLTEEEAGMSRELVNAQILLALKGCETGKDVTELLEDVRQHERDTLKKEGNFVKKGYL